MWPLILSRSNTAWPGAYGSPGVKCPHPKCGASVCSAHDVDGVATEYVCEVCGFIWSRDFGKDVQGRGWKKDPKRGWEPTR